MKKIPIKPCDPRVMRDRLADFIEEAKAESDRGIVLSGGALIEENLKILFWQFADELPSDGYTRDERRSYLNSFFGPGGIVGSHFYCSNLCFALGIIDEAMYRKLTDIRTVRNCAGHDLKFRLTSDKVTAALERHYDKEKVVPDSIRLFTPSYSDAGKLEENFLSISVSGDYVLSRDAQDENMTLFSEELTWQKLAFIQLIYEVGSELPRLAAKPSYSCRYAGAV